MIIENRKLLIRELIENDVNTIFKLTTTPIRAEIV